MVDSAQSTPLYLSAAAGRESCVASLIRAGSNPSAISEKGHVVIHAAAAGGR